MAPYTLSFYRKHDAGYDLVKTMEWDDEVLPDPPFENCLVVVEEHLARRRRIHSLSASRQDEISLRNRLLRLPAPIPNFERRPTFAIPLSSGHIDEYLPPPPHTPENWFEWVAPIRARHRYLTEKLARIPPSSATPVFGSSWSMKDELRAYLYGFENFLAWHLCKKGFQLVENNAVSWTTHKDQIWHLPPST